jgi:DNA-binding transcriptional ArsR family regulator
LFKDQIQQLLLRICAIEQTWVNRAMEQRVYRQSRLCRLLGNPLAFAVVNVLGENKELTPSEIARAIGRSVSRVSHVLTALRLAELVRYETDGRQARYRLKHPRETRQLLQALAKFIDSSSAFQ